jgi:hypothetical protein
MTTTDYLINTAFLLFVLSLGHERRLDLRSFLVPLVILRLGVVSGIATHVRRGGDGVAEARIGWLAGVLLLVGLAARMVGAEAYDHGAEPARTIKHHPVGT